MSDITKKISFLDDGPTASGPATIPPEPIDGPINESVADAPILRRSDDPLTPKSPADTPPIRSLVSLEPSTPPEPSRNLLWIAIGLSVLTALAIGAWTYGYFQLGSPRTELTPWAWAGLITAMVVPAATVLVAVPALRALRKLEASSERLTAVTDRLSRADSSVAGEMATLAGTIRQEIAGVDARLSQTRSQFEGFGANLSQQSRELDETTRTMAERSETIGRALTLHRQAFESLANTFDAQMESLSAQIDLQRGRLTDSTSKAETDVNTAAATLSDAGAILSKTIEAASGSSRAAEASLSEAEDRLAAMITRIQDSAQELDGVYERRSSHLAGLADRLSGERDGTQAAILAQTERLGAIDAQIEITETRLTALVDHARDIQESLAEQLAQIDATLDGAEARTQRFTEGLAERVTDSVAETRRDLSLMEAELRALQSRLDGARDDGLDLEGGQINAPKERRRVTLKPLDTDFPPVEPPPTEPETRAQPEAQAEPLELVEPLAIPEAAPPAEPPPQTDAVQVEPIPEMPEDAPMQRDVIRRPGETAPPKRTRSKTVFGKANNDDDKAGWRWRDMLGGIDPVDTPVAPDVVRPPAGVPLSPPAAAPQLPDGSDVVARLCEVKLAPSAVVDEGTIMDAGRIRLTGGEIRMVDVVVARLRDPVSHLRGVLSADLEFKLRAESFARSYAARLDATKDDAEMRALLGSASGRAYLLCAAALHG